MASNPKTPITVLQELVVKRYRGSPKYTIVHARQGTHENEFQYQVVFENISATGIGPSKRIAKHAAAQRALDKLANLGVYIPFETVFKPPAAETFTNGNTTITVNSIGALSDLCVKNKIFLPTYHVVSEFGPPHYKRFTCMCKIASIQTAGTARTKKQAKQLAAKEMLERIKNVLPEVAAECINNVAVISETDEGASAICSRLESNLSVHLSIHPVKDYATNIKKIIQKKELDIKKLKEYLRETKTLPRFKKLLNEMDLECCIEQVQVDPVLVILKVNLDIPFSVLATGSNYEEGIQNVVNKSFEYMDVLVS